MAAVEGKKLDLDPKYDDYEYPVIAPTPQNGHPGHTTPEQDAQVFQLRSLLEQAGQKKNLDTLTLVGPACPTDALAVRVANAQSASVSPSTKVQCRDGETDVRIYGDLLVLEYKADRIRFLDSEKWREEFAGCGVEELVRTFEYKERAQVFEYYPQYYHKTDKVRIFVL